jgi:hypothetical protein
MENVCLEADVNNQSYNHYHIDVCWTKLKKKQIELSKISHRFLMTIKVFLGEAPHNVCPVLS